MSSLYNVDGIRSGSLKRSYLFVSLISCKWSYYISRVRLSSFYGRGCLRILVKVDSIVYHQLFPEFAKNSFKPADIRYQMMTLPPTYISRCQVIIIFDKIPEYYYSRYLFDLLHIIICLNIALIHIHTWKCDWKMVVMVPRFSRGTDSQTVIIRLYSVAHFVAQVTNF